MWFLCLSSPQVQNTLSYRKQTHIYVDNFYCEMFGHKFHLNPSAWSNEHCSPRENFTCRGATSAARLLHCLTHSTISRQHRKKM